MTPAERLRLAEALEHLTGEPWATGIGYGDAPAIDGATRLRGTVHTRITLVRIGDEGWLITGQFGQRRHRFPGHYAGRGWFDRFVEAALKMIAAFDMGALDCVLPTAPDDKNARRVAHYRRLLAPDSGASDNERAIAARRLGTV